MSDIKESVVYDDFESGELYLSIAKVNMIMSIKERKYLIQK